MGVRDGSGCLPIIQLVIRIGRIKLHRESQDRLRHTERKEGRKAGFQKSSL